MIHLERHGSGPAVLLLHGTPTTVEHMRPLALHLAATHEAIVVHLPGYGETPTADDRTFDGVTERVEETLRAANVRTAALVGFSGGAFRALWLAARGTLEVPAVVSLGGFAQLVEEERDGFRAFAAAVRAGADIGDAMVSRLLSPRGAELPGAVEEVRRWRHATPEDNLAAELDALADASSVIADLADLDVPVVARVGELDLAAPPDKSREIVEAVRNGELQVVAGCGHSLLLEDSEQTFRAVARACAR